MQTPHAPRAEPTDDASVVSVLENIRGHATGSDTQVRDILEALGAASFIPNLMLPALAVISPLSGIPLFSSTCGILIALVSAQMLMGRDHIWLPEFLMRRSISSQRLRTAIEKLRTPAGWIDRLTRQRLTFLLRRPSIWLVQLTCMAAGLSMPLLELLPFTSSILGVVVFLMSLAMLARDGVLVVIAACVLAVLPVTALWLIGG